MVWRLWFGPLRRHEGAASDGEEAFVDGVVASRQERLRGKRPDGEAFEGDEVPFILEGLDKDQELREGSRECGVDGELQQVYASGGCVVEGVSDGEFCGELGDRESGCLGCQRRRTGCTRIDLNNDNSV